MDGLYQPCPHGSLWLRDCHECQVKADLRKQVASADLSKLEERVLAMDPIPTLPGAPPPPTTGRTGLENWQAAIPQIQGAGEESSASPTPAPDERRGRGQEGRAMSSDRVLVPAVLTPEMYDAWVLAYAATEGDWQAADAVMIASAPPAPSSTLTIGRMTTTAGEDGRYHFRPTVMADAPEYCDGFAAAYKQATNEVLPYMHAPTAPSAEPSEPVAWMDAVLDIIDDAPGLTMEQDRWLSDAVRALAKTHPAPALPDGTVEAMRGALGALIALRGVDVYAGEPVTDAEADQAIDALRAQIAQIGGDR